MKELKAGDSLDFVVGGKTLTIEPVPFGQIKKILRAVVTESGAKEVSDITIINIADKYIGQIFPLMFPKGKYDFLKDEWLEDNMTIPVLRKMLESAIVVNGLQDFFEKLVGRKLTPAAEAPEPSELVSTIPLAKDGSTISAGSLTDGDPKMSTN